MQTAKVSHICKFISMRIVLLSATLVFLSSCDSSTSNPKANQPSTAAVHQLPTASEVFYLRSECAKLGEKILDNNFIGRALTQSQVSRYNPKINRCYVELTVQSADMTKQAEIMSRYLFDGQTREMLDYAKIEKGKQSGMSFKKEGITGFEEARSYIDETMKDD